MSLFRNQNKFEDKLKKQLEELDLKPSASLWDRIDANLPVDGFEKSVRTQLEGYEVPPRPETWHAIEKELPVAGKARYNRYYYWIPVLAFIFGAGIYGGMLLNEQPGTPIASVQPSATPQNIEQAHSHLPSDAASQVQQPQEPASDVNTSKHQLAASTIQPARPTLQTAQSDNPKSPPPAATMPVNTRVNQAMAVQEPESTSSISQAQPLAKAKPAAAERVTTMEGPTSHNKTIIDTEDKPETFAPEPIKSTVTASKNQIVNKEAEAGSQVVSTKAGVAAANEAKSATETNADKSGVRSGNEAAASSSAQSSQSVAPVGSKEEKTSLAVSEVVKPAETSADPMVREVPRFVDTAFSTVAPKSVKPEEPLSNFSITIFGGTHYGYNQFTAPEGQNFDNNIKLRNKLESPELGMAGGFLFNYHADDRVLLSAGVTFLTFNQQVKFAITPAQSTHVGTEVGAHINNPQDSIVEGSSELNHSTYTWMEIPVYLTYTIARSRKVEFDIMAGMSYAMISGVDAGIISRDNVGIYIMTDKEAFPGIKNHFFVNINPSIAYRIDEKLSLGFMPTFKYAITSMIRSEDWVQQQPWFVGAALNLKRRF